VDTVRFVIADGQAASAIRALIGETYAALSTPGSRFEDLFGAADIAIAGSGQGEVWTGPAEVAGVAAAVSSSGFGWTAEDVTIWRQGDVAWARILGSVRLAGADVEEVVPYTTTAVFGVEGDGWRWLYWGGSEPQESPRV
jgi:hypothetical protein